MSRLRRDFLFGRAAPILGDWSLFVANAAALDSSFLEVSVANESSAAIDTPAGVCLNVFLRDIYEDD